MNTLAEKSADEAPWWKLTLIALMLCALGFGFTWFAIDAAREDLFGGDADAPARVLEHGLHYMLFSGAPLFLMGLLAFLNDVLKMPASAFLRSCMKYLIVGGLILLVIEPRLITIPIVESDLADRGYAECP